MSDQLSVGSARALRLDVDGHPIAALQAGDPGAPPVLLLPGYTGSKEDFAPLLDPLAAAGFRAVAIDLPGQFESPGPGAPGDYTPDRLAGPVAEVLDRLGPPVRLVGHSFGGLVARATAVAVPERLDSLALLSSGPAALGGNRRAAMNAFEPVLARDGVPGLWAAMQAVAGRDPRSVPPSGELAAFLERRFLAGSPTMLKGMADALRAEPDRVAELAAAGVRTLVVHGVDDDAWPPAEQGAMAERLRARYVVVPHAAHSAAIENPDGLAEVLVEFWSG